MSSSRSSAATRGTSTATLPRRWRVLMAEDEPDRYVANMSKAKRKGKIFVDYLRNTRGATAIAPFSTRSRAGASVALPVSWPQLAR